MGDQGSPAVTVARTAHTATLLLDGRLLIAGGTRDGAEPVATELWDFSAHEAATIGTGGLDRAGHTAMLIGDGRVLVAGGRTLEGNPISDSVVVYPALGSVSAIATERSRERPAVVASIPSSNATDVAADSHVALRFSEAMAVESLTSETLALSGPDGMVTSVVIAAEGGRLAFVWPAAPLSEGATRRGSSPTR